MAKFEKVEVLAKQVGQNLNVTVGTEKFTVSGSKEKLAPVKEVIKAYLDKPTQANHKMMMVALKPATVEKEKKVEEKKTEIAVAKSKAKKAVKEAPVEEKKAAKGKGKVEKSKKGLLDQVAEAYGLGIEKVKEAIEGAKKVVQPKTTTTPTRRNGEW